MWQEARAFCQRAGLNFLNAELIEEALTHSTYAYEQGREQQNNERLEYLGDAVLQLIVSEWLFSYQPWLNEGRMTKIRALLVCESTLAQVALELGLGEALLLGHGEEGTQGRRKPSNLANALEAVFGALYLDQGLACARSFIHRQLAPWLSQAVAGKLRYDAKSLLLERAQAEKDRALVCFRIISEEGPVHECIFTAEVQWRGEAIAEGVGRSKKEAEQDAARKALSILSGEEEEKPPCISSR